MLKSHLILFFTKGVSLQTWDMAGMFDREVALYNKLYEHGVEVSFVTYGDRYDLDYAERIPGISICCNHWRMPQSKYEKRVPELHRVTLERADLIKTNQMIGSDIALDAAMKHNKPLIARCGFMRSEFDVRLFGKDSERAKKSSLLEEKVIDHADRIVVTTKGMRESILSRFPHLKDSIRVVPNYVDTDIFHPVEQKQDRSNHICYIGRLDQKQKNVLSLIEAVDGLGAGLELIGDGPLRKELEQKTSDNPQLKLLGRIPNSDLPRQLRRCSVFILPSFFEGHPKTLIEAMACGLPVIGTDVAGINNVIRHDETGWLCGTDPSSLRRAISTVMSDKALQKRLGHNARRFAVENYALDKVVQIELRIYSELFDLQMSKTQIPVYL